VIKFRYKGGLIMQYTPISFKTDYSLMKSLLKVSDIIKYAKKMNSKYVGILDNNPYGILDFYDKCTQNNLKCIFGMVVKFGEYKIYFYIRNYTGYLNLIKINELINDNKLNINEVIKYNEGLIAVLPYESYKLYNRIKNVFLVYLGYKNDGELKNALLINKKVLFINEILYFKKEDVNFLKLLYKIAGSTYEDNTNYCIGANEFDTKTIEEFQSLIDLKFDFNKSYIPLFCKTQEESKKYLRTLAIKGLNKRLNNNVPEKYIERLKFELNTIENMGYIDYFLIVYDYVKYAKKNNIMVGPGRGSAAGSLVSYSLGITEIDPLKYDLLFERFLNPERVTMPDIDMDFEDVGRNKVIDYVREKYGSSRVALIVAYGTLGTKQVVRDVGKVLEIDDKKIDALSKKLDAKKSLKENLKDKNLVAFIKDNDLETMYKISIKLEGLKKHTTIHAAGVVISQEPINNIVPTFKTSDGILTGFTMEYLERLGLLKMDFLAIRNLTMIHNILDLIHKKNPTFDLKKIPLDDNETFEIFKKGDTDNIFQFESIGMKNFLKKLSPSKFDDLVAANALFRPGPMQNIDEYIARKKGEKRVTYLHKDLEPILKSTYGIIVYQEQIMQILSIMGGYTFAEADLIRRAMSKKKHDVMESEKTKFLHRATKKGYTKEIANETYNLIVKFADYGFNKSHSVAYALVGYQMAYLKANYGETFQLNNLNKDVIDEAIKKGLRIVKPDINKSSYKYIIDNSSIILPLTSIKDISTNVSKTIIDYAPYSDFFNFIKKVSKTINRKNIETLISAGALDSFNYSKNTLMENIDSAYTYIELCDNLDESLIMKPEIVESKIPDTQINEIETFGFYISGHPASRFTDKDAIKIKNLSKYKNQTIKMVVLVEKIKVINTKKGEKMAFIDVSDDTGKSNAVVFPNNNNLISTFKENDLIHIKANIGERNEESQIIINEIISIEQKDC